MPVVLHYIRFGLTIPTIPGSKRTNVENWEGY